MFAQPDIDRILAAMRAHGVTRLEIKDPKKRLRLSLPPATGSSPTAPGTPYSAAVTSPGIGRYLPRGGDDGMAELEPGARVLAGEVLGYLCSGPVRRVVVAPHDGIVPAEWPETGALLGYGDTVCRLETEQ